MSDLRHIGWWSDGNGFTPSYEKDTPRTANYMRSRGDQPVYIKASEKKSNGQASERHLRNSRAKP